MTSKLVGGAVHSATTTTTIEDGITVSETTIADTTSDTGMGIRVIATGFPTMDTARRDTTIATHTVPTEDSTTVTATVTESKSQGLTVPTS